MQTNNKLREALKQISEMSDRWYYGVDTSKSSEDVVVACGQLAEAALAEPVKNCEVGTAGDMVRRYNHFCATHRSSERCCDDCPAANKAPCEFEWTQMPYEEGGVK